MWIARNKIGTLCLFTRQTPPARNKPLDDPHSHFWEYNSGSLSGIIPLFKPRGYEVYNDSIFEEMFKNLKWEDEPIEIAIHERFPVHETTCLDCGTTFKYTTKDVESFTHEEPWNAGYFETEDWVKCPECGKYISLN